MIAQLEPIALNAGLTGLQQNVSHITVCAAEPTTYALATGANALVSLSFGAGSAFAAPAVIAGRLAVVPLLAASEGYAGSGIVATSGTANWWAAIDEVNSNLYAHDSVKTTVLTAGNVFYLSSFSIQMPQY